MQGYRSSAVACLAAQLRRGPLRLRLRQLHHIEFLLTIVAPDREYPFDFVRHVLTGYRPRAEERSGRLLSGTELVADLVTLAEELSGTARLSLADWPEPLYSAGDLARRFDVSTKTILRWHRRGLVGWRVVCPNRRSRLVFTERSVRRFVAQNLELVHRGICFSQLTAAERETILSRARELADAGARSVNAVARAIAAQTGRAVETVRLLLRQHDEAHPHQGIFNRPPLGVAGDDQRLRIWEAYQDGASIESLAQRFGCPVAQVYAAITFMRARELKTRPLEYVPSPEFERPDAEAVILRDPPEGCFEPAGHLPVPADLPPYLAQLFGLPLLTPAGERTLFRRMNYLKYKADRLRRALDAGQASATELDEIEGLLRQADEIRRQITQANLRLVVSIAKKHMRPGRDFFELISDGNLSLMRAVERFDYSRGFKFSTYASWAIMKNYARTLPLESQQAERFQTGRSELMESLAGPQPGDEADEDLLLVRRSALERMLNLLDQRERTILRQRYGLDRAGEPLTLEQIGLRLGVSKERVRQLEARAMSRLRGQFARDIQTLLG